mmetsp:Transcript_128093/g.358592  ORF Transcript_128093/g.358592 Transcript_128093/m.358592 type:complete len:291 (-) Transcript_128093:115-987(-)
MLPRVLGDPRLQLQARRLVRQPVEHELCVLSVGAVARQERRPLRVDVDAVQLGAVLEQLGHREEHHPGVVDAAVLLADHLDVQGLADLPHRMGTLVAPVRRLEERLRRHSQVDVSSELGRHRQAQVPTVPRQRELQVGASVRNSTARLAFGADVHERPLQCRDRLRQGPRPDEGVVRDAGELRAVLGDGRPQRLAVVLRLVGHLPVADVVDDERELDDLPLVRAHQPPLALVAGPLEVQADPEVELVVDGAGGPRRVHRPPQLHRRLRRVARPRRSQRGHGHGARRCQQR